MAARITHLDKETPGMFNLVNMLPARSHALLEKNWAPTFFNEVLCKLNVGPFAVLYSDNAATRPGTPILITVGAMIVQQFPDLSDDEMLEACAFNIQVMCALGIGAWDGPALSDRTLGRFRARLVDHYARTGGDLMYNCITSMAWSIADTMGIKGDIRRMDSMMIASSMQKLTRPGLAHRCCSLAVREMARLAGEASIPEDLQHFLKSSDFNEVTYRRKDEAGSELEKLLVEADQIVALWKEGGPDCTLQPFVNLTRFLSEQTIVKDGVRRLRTKKDGGMHSGMLQNPSDPEATCRKKAGKEHRVRVVNFEESVGKNGSVITDHAVEASNVSDQEMPGHKLEGMEPQEKEVSMAADGAYASDHIRELARAKNVRIIPTSLTGKKPRDICADFQFNSTGTAVTLCPCGHPPAQCDFHEKGGYCRVTMNASHCLNCPHREDCRAVLLKTVPVAKFNISFKQKNHAIMMREMTTEEGKAWARLRNGAETVPSNLRRNCNSDNLPRNTMRTRLVMGTRVGTCNFQKLVTYRTGTGRYAQNDLPG